MGRDHSKNKTGKLYYLCYLFLRQDSLYLSNGIEDGRDYTREPRGSHPTLSSSFLPQLLLCSRKCSTMILSSKPS